MDVTEILHAVTVSVLQTYTTDFKCNMMHKYIIPKVGTCVWSDDILRRSKHVAMNNQDTACNMQSWMYMEIYNGKFTASIFNFRILSSDHSLSQISYEHCSGLNHYKFIIV